MKTLKDYLEENSVKSLTNVGLIDRLVEFIRANPFPKDHAQFHKWAKDMGYEDVGDDAEEYAYAMLTVILCGGASKGKDIKVPNDKSKAVGTQIEREHTEMDSDNAVVHKIQEVFQNKIMNDHHAETKDYYLKSINFIDDLKKGK